MFLLIPQFPLSFLISSYVVLFSVILSNFNLFPLVSSNFHLFPLVISSGESHLRSQRYSDAAASFENHLEAIMTPILPTQSTRVVAGGSRVEEEVVGVSIGNESSVVGREEQSSSSSTAVAGESAGESSIPLLLSSAQVHQCALLHRRLGLLYEHMLNDTDKALQHMEQALDLGLMDMTMRKYFASHPLKASVQEQRSAENPVTVTTDNSNSDSLTQSGEVVAVASSERMTGAEEQTGLTDDNRTAANPGSTSGIGDAPAQDTATSSTIHDDTPRRRSSLFRGRVSSDSSRSSGGIPNSSSDSIQHSSSSSDSSHGESSREAITANETVRESAVKSLSSGSGAAGRGTDVDVGDLEPHLSNPEEQSTGSPTNRRTHLVRVVERGGFDRHAWVVRRIPVNLSFASSSSGDDEEEGEVGQRQGQGHVYSDEGEEGGDGVDDSPFAAQYRKQEQQQEREQGDQQGRGVAAGSQSSLLSSLSSSRRAGAVGG